jgi:hypothetical protein
VLGAASTKRNDIVWVLKITNYSTNPKSLNKVNSWREDEEGRG